MSVHPLGFQRDAGKGNKAKTLQTGIKVIFQYPETITMSRPDTRGAVKFFMVLNPVAHAIEGHRQLVAFLATVNPQHFPCITP